MKNSFLSITLFLLVLSGRSQPITFHFSDSLYAEEDDSHSFVFLRHLSSDSISSQEVNHQIVFPENYLSQDTAFAMEYFTGFPGKITNRTSLLIGNYQSPNPVIHADLNNNLNFTDDGPPLPFQDSSVYLILNNSQDKAAKFATKYWLVDRDSSEIQYHNKNFGISTENKTQQGLMSSQYWFNSKRHNNKILKTTLSGDSVKIALHDFNINGRFDDANSDLIFINDVEIPFDSYPTSGCITLDSATTLFSFHNQVFQVTEIDPFGRFITIEPSALPYKKPLAPGDMMPDLKLPTPNGDSLSLKSMIDGQHYLVIDMWADWCKPCRNSAPQLKMFAEKHKDKITMLGVSPHNVNDAVAKYTAQYDHDWTQALTTKEFMKTFLAEEYPRYILIDPTGKIISLRTYPHKIEELIN